MHGLLLAAGAGTRMGMPKALVRAPDGEPWLVRGVRALTDGGCTQVSVVLGASAEEALPLLEGTGATAVVAADWEDGMSASLHAGLAAALVTDADAVGAMVGAVGLELGAVDVLVNNAGIPPQEAWSATPFHETPTTDWDRWIGLNLHGVLNCTHAVLGGMVEAGWGRVVTIVSDAGRVGEPHVAVYAGAKAGAMGFSRAIAKEVAHRGVTVNCVALGTLEWPGGGPEEYAEHAHGYPVGRLGRPGDVAPAVLYLASEEAAWVTGQTLPVNGGYSTS